VEAMVPWAEHVSAGFVSRKIEEGVRENEGKYYKMEEKTTCMK